MSTSLLLYSLQLFLELCFCMTHFIAIHKCIWFAILIDKSEIADVLLNNKIYIIGGFENGHSTSTVEGYAPALDKWSNVVPLYYSH